MLPKYIILFKIPRLSLKIDSVTPGELNKYNMIGEHEMICFDRNPQIHQKHVHTAFKNAS